MYTHYYIDVGEPPKHLIDYINAQQSASTTTVLMPAASDSIHLNQTNYLINSLSDQQTVDQFDATEDKINYISR